MKYYHKPGGVIDYANGGTARTSNEIIEIGSLVGVAVDDIAANETGPVRIAGAIRNLTKLAGEAWAQGEVVYWDDGNSRFTTTDPGGGVPTGSAFEAAGSADVVGTVLLNNMVA